MPLSQRIIQDFEPELVHLRDELQRVHANRQNPETMDGVRRGSINHPIPAGPHEHGRPAGSRYEEMRHVLCIDERAEAALRRALQFCLWQKGERLGMEPRFRRHLGVNNLTVEDITAALLIDAPEALREVCVNIYRLIQGNQVWHVLVNDAISHPFHGDAKMPKPLNGELRQVVSPRGVSFEREARSGSHSDHSYRYAGGIDTQAVPVVEVRGPHPGSVSKIDRNGRQQKAVGKRIYLPDAVVEREGHRKFQEIMETTETIDHQFFYGVSVNLADLKIEGARFINVSGQMRALALEETILVPGPEFQGRGMEMQHGTLVLTTDSRACFSSCFFLGTNIELSGEGDLNAEFRGCDFSLAEINEADLPRLAARCDETCVFSEAQMAIVDPCQERFLSETNAMKRIMRLAPGEKHGLRRVKSPLGIGRLPDSSMHSDQVSEREDIADAPTLRTAGINRFHRDGWDGRRTQVTDERILTPLSPEHGSHLGPRIRFAGLLAERVREMEEYSVETMFAFLVEQGGEDLSCVLGLEGTIDHLPIDLLHLPNQLQGGDRESRIFHPARNTRSGNFEKTLSFPDSKEAYEAIYYTYIHQLRRALFDLCERLYHYGRYIVELMDTHNYNLPEADAEATSFKFRGLFQPNLPAKLAASDDGGELILNDIELPVSDGSHLLALTGPNKITGKTRVMDALARAVEQAQRGAPTPGQVRVPSSGLFDGVFIMPNIRSTMGGDESGMEGRAQIVLEEFVGRMKGITAEGRTPRVLVCLDEIMMGVTRPDDAFVIESNFIDELMTLDNVNVNIVLVSPDGRVIRALMRRFPDRITIMAPDPEAESSYKLKVSEEPAESSAAAVLEEKGLGKYLEKKVWMEE